MNNLHNLLADSLLNNINQKFIKQNIITLDIIKEVLTKIDIQDKVKVKYIYNKLIEKIKNNENSTKDDISNNINNDTKDTYNINNLLPYSKNINQINSENIDVKTNKEVSITSNKDLSLDNTSIKIFFLNICNNYRDIKVYPNCFDYSIFFNTTDDNPGNIKDNLNNIKKLTLCNILLSNSLEDNPYLLLEIEEIFGQYISNNINLKNTFCILDYYKACNNYRYYKIDKEIEFDVPKSFNKLSFKIRNFKGEILNTDETLMYLTFKLEKMNINFFENYADLSIKDKN